MVRIPFKIHLIRFSICQDLRFSVVNNIMNVYVRGVWYNPPARSPATHHNGTDGLYATAFIPNGNEWFLSSLIIQSGVFRITFSHSIPENVFGPNQSLLKYITSHLSRSRSRARNQFQSKITNSLYQLHQKIKSSIVIRSCRMGSQLCELHYDGAHYYAYTSYEIGIMELCRPLNLWSMGKIQIIYMLTPHTHTHTSICVQVFC